MANDKFPEREEAQQSAQIKFGRRKGNAIDLRVGSRIRERRLMLGMTQGALGELLGLTFQQVQKYEKGANGVGASRLLDLSIILRAPIEYFYRVSGERLGPADDPVLASEVMLGTRECLELNKNFAKITDENARCSIIAMVLALAGSSTSE
jgi:transcriptional regulator with XRE-family HTH domain